MSAAPLPIESALPDLHRALDAHRNVVLQAPPGAGKSTRVPLALLDSAWLKQQRIVMLEPRRLAARAVAMRMAQTLRQCVGHSVGYRTRLESRISAATRIEVVTEGILTRWLQNDPTLEGIGLVIFDEFHERNLQADLGLALALDAQDTVREDLRILVMSATLDGEAVASLLDTPAIVTATGKAFPVATHYRARVDSGGPRWQEDIARSMATAILTALDAEHGDVLAFLPGQGEIRRTQRLLEEAALPARTRVLPLYGELPIEQQNAAIHPSGDGIRKVVLATNIAETSLTIEGVRIVIDSGLARRARFDPATAMSRLELVRIPRAGADQRRGRAGRLEPGICYRLWSKTEHAALAPHTVAEIMEADLAPLALELANWGVSDPARLRWLNVPPAASFARARDLLTELEALDGTGRITAHGRALANLAAHPRLAHMIVRGSEHAQRRLALEICALLGERDLLRSGVAERNIDLRLRIEALRGDRTLPRDIGVDGPARERVLRSIEQLSRQVDRQTTHRAANERDKPTTQEDAPDTTHVGRMLALAYPDRIALSRGDSGRYLLSSGRGARLMSPQSLGQERLLVIADLDAGEREASIRLAAPIAQGALEALFPHRVVTRDRIEWDSREQAVVAQRERWFGALKLEERRLEKPDPTSIGVALLTGIREMGIAQLPWSNPARALQTRMQFAHRLDSTADPPWPDVSDPALASTLDHWLAPWLNGMSRRDHLGRLDLHAALLALLDWNQQRRLGEFAPTHLSVPSGSHIPIDYSGDTPSVAVRLQEVFGLLATPTIAAGRVPLTLQLLSPAHRPVQVTRDLQSFWARGYPEVKKELKGRYPKHHWPDDPLTAQPTARAKKRGT